MPHAFMYFAKIVSTGNSTRKMQMYTYKVTEQMIFQGLAVW